MKIEYIQLFNFRQFYSKTPKIHFASGKKNVTVLHANNGSGKTAILNAFTWALYDTFTPGFKLSDQLVNKRAIREVAVGERVEAWVQIKFEHDGLHYVVKRTQEVLRIEDEPGWQTHPSTKATLEFENNGSWDVESNFEGRIGRVLPKDLHNYFFFDGERIERIVHPGSKQRKEIKNAAKKLLGLEMVERGIGHLENAKKELENELINIGDESIASAIKEKQRLESLIKELDSENKNHRVEINNLKDLTQEVIKLLKSFEEVKSIEEERERLRLQKESNMNDIKAKTIDLKALVSKQGYLAFQKELVDSFQAQLELMREKGELPAGIKKQFVEDLIHQAKCICGTELKVGSDALQLVERWKEQAGLADVEERALTMGGELSTFEEHYNHLADSLSKLKNDIYELKQMNSSIEIALEDISEKLKNCPQEKVSELEKRREDYEEKTKDLEVEIRTNERDIKHHQESIAEKEREIKELQASESKQRLAHRRIEAAKDAHTRMKQMLQLYDGAFRAQLEDKLGSLFSKMSVTPYTPYLDGDYAISLQEEAGGSRMEVASSQGESQILSLSFIGAIIDVVRDQLSKQSSLPGLNAASYPVVMDSPFGALDHNYRKQIASNLPTIADQVVVLVSKTQWRGEVEDEMRYKIGREYVLTYFSPRDDIEVNDSVIIAGNEMSLVKKSPNEFEYTEVQEVRYD